MNRRLLPAVLAEIVRALAVLSIYFLALTPLSVGAYQPRDPAFVAFEANASFCGAGTETGQSGESCGLCLLNHAVSTLPPLPAICPVHLSAIELAGPAIAAPVPALVPFLSPQTRAPPSTLAI
ncbi:MAG: hypothetical protein H6873_02220 [Hyphomicrobiaceae bacterium]|nr:hypothetical protein [Hyphomicrobiaceae bacterium]